MIRNQSNPTSSQQVSLPDAPGRKARGKRFSAEEISTWIKDEINPRIAAARAGQAPESWGALTVAAIASSQRERSLLHGVATRYGRHPNDWYGALLNLGVTATEIALIRACANERRRSISKIANLSCSPDQVESWIAEKVVPLLAAARSSNADADWLKLSRPQMASAKQYGSFCSLHGKSHEDWYGALLDIGVDPGEVVRIRNVAKSRAAAERGLSSRTISDHELSAWIENELLPKLACARQTDRAENWAALSFASFRSHPYCAVFCNARTKYGSDWYGALATIGVSAEELDKIRGATLAGAVNKRLTPLHAENERMVSEELMPLLKFARVTGSDQAWAALRLSAFEDRPGFTTFCLRYGGGRYAWYKAIAATLALTDEEVSKIRSAAVRWRAEEQGNERRGFSKEAVAQWVESQLLPLLHTAQRLNTQDAWEALSPSTLGSQPQARSFCSVYTSNSHAWYAALRVFGVPAADVERISKAARKMGGRKIAERRRSFSSEEVAQGIEAEVKKLAQSAREAGEAKSWAALGRPMFSTHPQFSSFCTLHARWSKDWYGALRKIGILDAEIRLIREQTWDSMRERRSQYSEAEIKEGLLKELAAIAAFARRDMQPAAWAKLTKRLFRAHPQFASFCSRYGRSSKDWYEALGNALKLTASERRLLFQGAHIGAGDRPRLIICAARAILAKLRNHLDGAASR